MVYIYTAVFELQEDGISYYAKVPDVPGCVATGKDLADALEQITDALSGCLVVAEDEGVEIAKPTAQCDISVPAGGACSLVKVDTIAYRARTDTRSSRKNVPFPPG